MQSEEKNKVPEQTVFEFGSKTYTFGKDNKVETNFHDFKKVDTVMGELLSVEDLGNGNTYKIKQADNTEITVGSYGVLQGKIKPKGDIGKILRIVYMGDEKSTKSKWTYMNFEVFVMDKEN